MKGYNRYMGGTDKNDQMTRLHRTRRHHRWPRRLFVKFVLWALYNAYVLFQTLQPAKAKGMSFRQFMDQYSLKLVGGFRSSALNRQLLNPEADARLLNVALHHPVILQDDSTNHVCAVCSYKYNKFKKENPNVAYKDYPVKAVKSSVSCTQCERHFCIKRGSTCWVDWHTKVQFWRLHHGKLSYHIHTKFQEAIFHRFEAIGNHSMSIENKEKLLGSSGRGARYLWGLRAQRVKV